MGSLSSPMAVASSPPVSAIPPTMTSAPPPDTNTATTVTMAGTETNHNVSQQDDISTDARHSTKPVTLSLRFRASVTSTALSSSYSSPTLASPSFGLGTVRPFLSSTMARPPSLSIQAATSEGTVLAKSDIVRRSTTPSWSLTVAANQGAHITLRFYNHPDNEENLHNDDNTAPTPFGTPIHTTVKELLDAAYFSVMVDGIMHGRKLHLHVVEAVVSDSVLVGTNSHKETTAERTSNTEAVHEEKDDDDDDDALEELVQFNHEADAVNQDVVTPPTGQLFDRAFAMPTGSLGKDKANQQQEEMLVFESFDDDNDHNDDDSALLEDIPGLSYSLGNDGHDDVDYEGNDDDDDHDKGDKKIPNEADSKVASQQITDAST